MKFLLDNWMLVSLALASGIGLCWPWLSLSHLTQINTATAVAWMNGQEGQKGQKKALLLDVRTPEEFAKSHPVRAKNLPLAALPNQLAQLCKDKNQALIFTCAFGTRAKKAAALAKKAGYLRAVALAGGLNAWKKDGLPVVQTETKA